MLHKNIRFWLVGLVLGCLLPATIGSAVLFSISYEQQRSNFEQNTVATARALVQAVDGELFGLQTGLQVLAASKRLATGDFGGFYQQATEALPHLNGSFIVVTDPSGQRRVDTRLAWGEVLEQRAPSEQTRRMLESAQPMISDFIVVPGADAPGVTIDVPVIVAGKVEYALSIGIDVRRFRDILRRQRLPPDWISAIVDGAGTIAARSIAEDRYVGKKASPSFLRRAAESPEGVTDATTLEGVDISSAYSRSPRSGWQIAIGMPKASLSGNLLRSAGIHAAVMAGLLVLSLLMAKTFGTQISNSIKSLRAPALSLGTERLTAIPLTNIAEVDEVAAALIKASQLIEQQRTERERSEAAARHLMVAKQSAEQASRTRSEFLASMSHELRTPLHAISGFAQLLSRAGDTPLNAEKRDRYTSNIVEASSQLAKIIDDILEMALLETGKVTLKTEVLDCLEVMTEVSRVLEASAKKRGILFSVDTSGNLPSIVADRGRLIQILLNLGSNAIKYNLDDGWVLLTAIPGDGVVRFVVRDTGKGIPARRHAEVFEPFNRLGIELTEEEGTGIGLTISRRLAEAMNGKIGFESEEGEGSVFWLELPAASEIPMTVPSVPSLFRVSAPTTATVLYIEDKIANLELMRAVIEDFHDINFLSARTVEEGVNLARSAMPDLVITDIHLPDGKGYDVLRQLRAESRTKHIPVIALTADAMPANMHNMGMAGFDYILTKPLEIDSLTTILRARLRAA